jgi:hypothetical protein
VGATASRRQSGRFEADCHLAVALGHHGGMAEQQMSGGNMTEGVVRVSNTVRRPAHANSEFVLGSRLALAP